MSTRQAELPVEALEVLRQRRSAKWRTYPADVLPLTVAEMDYSLAPPVAEALRAAVNRSDTGYATSNSGLGDALATFARSHWDWEIDPASVTAVTDVGAGVVELLRVLTRAGDTVVINTPVYPPFFDWVPEAGATTVEVPLAQSEAGWQLDLSALEMTFATHPAAFLLCNPHNPVGRVHSAQDLEAVVQLAQKYQVTVVSDEIHAPLVLPGAAFTPLLSVPGAAEIAVSVLSASKAWNLAGLKCAMVVTASDAMAAVVADFPPDVRWRTGHLGVLASIAAYENGEEWLDRLVETLGRRRSQLLTLLSQHLPSIAWHPPDATYLAWLDCRALDITGQPREVFLERGRVALEPGLRFGREGDGFVRLNFATSAEILADAVARMSRSVL
jgi:cysteine-S-conjugate beta-lyase